MSKITSEILEKVAPRTPKAKRDRFIPYLNECLPRYGITTELRVSAFLTTVCFESDYFQALREYASGWDYDITVNKKKALALGNTEKGDGPKYKGGTGIQTTGKNNFRDLTERIGKRDGVDFVKHPEKIAQLKYFVEGACVYWDDHNFNKLADKGKIEAIQNLTNRGDADKPAKALRDRLRIYASVLHILPDDFELDAAEEVKPKIPEIKVEGNKSENDIVAEEAATIEKTSDTSDIVSEDDPADTDQGSIAKEEPPIDPKPNSVEEPVKSSLWDRSWDKLSGFQSKLDKITTAKDSLSPISGSSKFTFVLTKALGWLLIALGFFVDHILWFIGLSLVAIAIWYFAQAKKNASKRTEVKSPSQEQKLVINN